MKQKIYILNLKFLRKSKIIQTYYNNNDDDDDDGRDGGGNE